MEFSEREPKIGIALGGGGVRGLAHLPLLAVFDEMGIRPHAVAGTSMGAIIGTIYASGVSAETIRDKLMRHVITKDDTVKTVYRKRKNLAKWFDAIKLELGTGGFLRVDGFFNYLFEWVEKSSFEEMEISATVVAADYWTGEEIRISSGDLLPAVRASMAVPGVFTPVQHDGRILVDGGLVNVVPYDIVGEECDITVAIDVGGDRSPRKGKLLPPPADAVMRSFEIQQDAMLREKMKWLKPDIYIRPEFDNMGLLEFDKMDTAFEQGELCRTELKQCLLNEISKFKNGRKVLPDLLPFA